MSVQIPAPALGGARRPADRTGVRAFPAAGLTVVRPAALLALALLAALLVPSIAGAAKPTARFAYAARPMTFGIYPGGGAGTVGPSGRTIPEDPTLRLAALQQLRVPGRPFVLHLYDEFRTRADGAAVPSWLADEIRAYTGAGFEVELVLRYRPAAAEGDVAGYADYVRRRVRQLGANPRVTALQITNESNVTGAPGAADGAYPRAREALVAGVVAAGRAKRDAGRSQLRIGFNWAFQQGRREEAYFAGLRALAAGTPFRRSLDWVGIDAYPGTWGPWLPGATLASGARRTTLAALRALRSRYLPLAGLRRVPLHVSEAGYPTGPGRTPAMQTAVLRSVTRAISAYRTRYGVTDLRWFDLRDADSSSASFESQYGLMRDDYTPKPAFHAFRAVVRRLG